jgi:hypothetical protein
MVLARKTNVLTLGLDSCYSEANNRRLIVSAVLLFESSERDVTEVTKLTKHCLEIINEGEEEDLVDDGDN